RRRRPRGAPSGKLSQARPPIPKREEAAVRPRPPWSWRFTMRRYMYILALMAAVRLALPAEAGIFGKSNKTKPEERVPQLLTVLKGDPDEHKREAAAKELRDFDAT